MAKLYQILEQTFKLRINSNSEIIPYIKKLSEMGRFDEPKKIAAIAIVLDRLGKLEDESDMEKSLSDIATPPANPPSVENQTPPSQSHDVPASTETILPASEQEIPTVSEFTPENISDLTPKEPSDSTTS